MGDTDTRDLAITAMTKIDSHIDACERRYNEGNQKLERIFEYIKDSHNETTKKIDDTTNDTNGKIAAAIQSINDMQNVLAEARGAGKLGKIITHGISGLVGGGSVTAVVHFLK
jgi:hypothetical protein